MTYTIRRLLSTPGFSLLVIGTIVFAVGVNAGLVSVTKSILQAAPGIPEFDRLVHYTIGRSPDSIPFSGPAYEALRANEALGDLAIWNSAVGLVSQTQDEAVR